MAQIRRCYHIELDRNRVINSQSRFLDRNSTLVPSRQTRWKHAMMHMFEKQQGNTCVSVSSNRSFRKERSDMIRFCSFHLRRSNVVSRAWLEEGEITPIHSSGVCPHHVWQGAGIASNTTSYSLTKTIKYTWPSAYWHPCYLQSFTIPCTILWWPRGSSTISCVRPGMFTDSIRMTCSEIDLRRLTGLFHIRSYINTLAPPLLSTNIEPLSCWLFYYTPSSTHSPFLGQWRYHS